MYERTYYFDAAALFVLLPLFVATITKKLYKNASSKVFVLVLIAIFLCGICDILSCFPNEFGANVTWVTTTFYFVFRAMLPMLYLVYLIVLTDCVNKLKKNKIFGSLVFIPYLVVLVLVIISSGTGLIFSIENIDGNVQYQRGPLIWIVYATSAIYIVFCMYYIIRYKKFFSTHQFVSLIAIVPVSLASVLLQYFFPWLLVEVFSSVLALVLASLSIEAPDELVDNKTGMLTSKQFYIYVKRSYIMNKEYSIILINFYNFSEIYNMFDFDDSTKFVKDLANMFNNHYRSINRSYKAYFIDDGLFAINVNSKENAKLLADNIVMDLGGLKNRTGYNPKYNIALIDAINDFEDMSSLVAFINNLHFEPMFKDNYVDISEIKDEKSFVIRNKIESIIEDGLKNNEFEVYYQPIYDVHEKKFRSAEALIRLNSKKYGFIIPGLFINHAEKNGKIIQIDDFVYDSVFKFISSEEFKDLGLEYIEVNLSMLDCQDKYLLDRIRKLFNKYNIESNKINFEITESLDADYSRIDYNIKKIKDLGSSLSLDDYGTGFSNIERFSTLPIDIVKIDKTLADKYKEDNMSCVLKNTFNMIKGMNRKIVVEGVEEEQQANSLIEYGCDYIQGYYYSKPLPKDKFIEFIKEHNKD
ncbi:MAG: EAL domain-containing protein [Acholeplasmatales bacterium]|nr:EAL domain-containing protein [Acholeplasmatales bacterium]